MQELKLADLFSTLTPIQQRTFLNFLVESKKSGRYLSQVHIPWTKWRVWYRSKKVAGGKDYMYMFAKTEQQARDLCCEVRHRKLDITHVEIVP